MPKFPKVLANRVVTLALNEIRFYFEIAYENTFEVMSLKNYLKLNNCMRIIHISVFLENRKQIIVHFLHGIKLFKFFYHSQKRISRQI
ncbi:hypothetical protein BpHYR1_023205 [Brachionus plicatilis]|uniref:Uncharacterized protein n=1 Tax=Brachionus plicatilis TaxID=10195 RepID=A0A3M7PTR6_BRAPC|nr:hypothetical protein BpHYR1_023205 [Brachionus plicatilis]